MYSFMCSFSRLEHKEGGRSPKALCCVLLSGLKVKTGLKVRRNKEGHYVIPVLLQISFFSFSPLPRGGRTGGSCHALERTFGSRKSKRKG